MHPGEARGVPVWPERLEPYEPRRARRTRRCRGCGRSVTSYRWRGIPPGPSVSMPSRVASASIGSSTSHHEQHRGRRRQHKPTGLFDRTRDSRVRASDNRPQTEVPPTGDTRRAHSRGATWDNPIRHHQKLKPWRWRGSSLTAPSTAPVQDHQCADQRTEPSHPSIRASVSCALRRQ
jgi:hypothetical protein